MVMMGGAEFGTLRPLLASFHLLFVQILVVEHVKQTVLVRQAGRHVVDYRDAEKRCE